MRPRNKISRSCLETTLLFSVFAAFQWCLSIVQLCCERGPSAGVGLLTVGSGCAHSSQKDPSSPPPPHPDGMERHRLLLPWFVGGCWPHKQLQGNVHTFLWWAPRTHSEPLLPHSRPNTSSSDFSLHLWSSISQFIVLAPRWWTVTFCFDACSNLCPFHRQSCLFPLGTVNVKGCALLWKSVNSRTIFPNIFQGNPVVLENVQ